jgi:ribonucleoside-diphosphate reductase alpha chain
MARHLGSFARYPENREDMLRVCATTVQQLMMLRGAYTGLSINPQGIKAQYCPDYLLSAACKAWDEAVEMGEKYGYRNAQSTVIAPTGTFGLVMDCRYNRCGT